MLTLRGLTLLVVAVVLWAVGRILGVPEMFVLAAASAALVPLAAVAVRMSSASMAVRRRLSTSRLAAHAQAEVEIMLRNDSRLPSSLLLVQDHCPPALVEQPPRFVVPGLRRGGTDPGSTVALSYLVTGARRGRHVIGPLTLRVRDPFGLVERVRRYHSTTDLLVHPEVEALPPSLSRGAAAGSGSSAERRLLNAGDEFYTMREYVSGDDLRQVHWPSTAHRRKLMVRQQEMPWQAQATVLLDTRASLHLGHGPDSTLDRAVSAAASLAAHLVAGRYDLRLVTADQDRAPAPQPLAVMLDRLAEVEATSARSLAPLLTRLRTSGAADGLLAVVLGAPPVGGPGLAQEPDVRSLLLAARGRSGRLCVIVDRYRGPTSASSPASDLAALLRGGGWQAVVVAPGQALGPALAASLPAARRTFVGGARPGSAHT